MIWSEATWRRTVPKRVNFVVSGHVQGGRLKRRFPLVCATRSIAGGLAGITAVLFTYPLELVRKAYRICDDVCYAIQLGLVDALSVLATGSRSACTPRCGHRARRRPPPHISTPPAPPFFLLSPHRVVNLPSSSSPSRRAVIAVIAPSLPIDDQE